MQEGRPKTEDAEISSLPTSQPLQPDNHDNP